MIKSEDISVVVQGAVSKQFTQKVLKSIRKCLPNAEIILSTWEDSDLRNLDYDALIENEDPGAEILYRGSNVQHNLNRQIVSSINGIKAATRKYVLKTRTDVLLEHNGFIDYFNHFPKRNESYRILHNRVIICQYYSRIASDLPFHPSDWAFFGLKEDVENIFDIPLAPEPETTSWFYEHPLRNRHNNKNYPFHFFRHRYCAEQYIWSKFLQKYVDFEFKDMFDVSPENIYLTEISFANNLLILSDKQYGLKFLKGKPAEFSPYYSYLDWLKLYKKYCDNDYKIPIIKYDKKLNKYKQKFGKHINVVKKPYYITINFIKSLFNWLSNILSSLFYFTKLCIRFINLILKVIISTILKEEKTSLIHKITFLGYSIYEHGIDFKTGRKIHTILGINLHKNTPEKFFKKIIYTIPKDVEDIYIIRQSTGESYILANIVNEWCKFNKSKNPYFIFTRPYHQDLFNLFANKEFNYNYEYKKIHPGDFPYFYKNMYKYKNRNFYIFLDQTFLFNLVENLIHKSNKQFVSEIAHYLNVDNYQELFKPPIIQDKYISFAKEYIKSNKLQEGEFVVLFEKSYTVEPPDCIFWKNLKSQLVEHNIKYIINNENLSFSQLIAICDMAKAIISSRTGAIEFLTSLHKPMHIMYGNITRFNLNTQKAIKTYSLSKYPNVNTDVLYEYEYDSLNSRKIIEIIVNTIRGKS